MKKILCMLLALLMFASVLFACAENEQENMGSNGANTEQEIADPNYRDEVPELSFNETVTILSKDKMGVNDEFFAESSTETQSDVVAHAVYQRNMYVEDRLGVELDMLMDAEPVAKHSTAVTGGSNDYDIVADSTFLAIQAVLKGEFINLRDVQYINLDKYYWTQGYNHIVSFGEDNKQYLASGALALSMFRYMFVTAYNREVFEALGEADLYEVVNNGEWTLDYQNQIIADRYQDSGETPNKRDETDMYGLITGDTVSVDPYCVAANIQLVSKKVDDGTWFYNTDQFERTVELCTKVQALYNNASTYVFKTATYDDTGKTDIVEAFAKSRSMMATVQVFALETNVADLAQFDYGIAPMPKFDEKQENYATYVQDQVTAVGISSSILDEDRLAMLGAVLECMASKSYASVVDAYYSTALSYQYLQNKESKEMLDLIYNSLTFDFTGACSNIIMNNGGQSIRDQLRPLFSGKSTKLGSTLSKWEKGTNKALIKINDFLMNLDY